MVSRQKRGKRLYMHIPSSHLGNIFFTSDQLNLFDNTLTNLIYSTRLCIYHLLFFLWWPQDILFIDMTCPWLYFHKIIKDLHLSHSYLYCIVEMELIDINRTKYIDQFQKEDQNPIMQNHDKGVNE